MKTIKHIIWSLAILLATHMQAQVTVNTTLIPPTSSSINDFKSISKVNVLFISNSREFGFAQVTISGNNGITISNNHVPNSYTSVALNAGIPASITSQQLNEIFNISNLVFTGMNSQQQQAFRESGTLPDGVYSVCFEFWSYGGTPAKISNPAPNGCASWIVGSGNSFSNSLREPPRTIIPACQTNVTAIDPQQLVFTWLDPSAFSDLSRGPQQYIIKMVEVPGSKSPYDAIATTSVPPLFEKTVFGTSYVYGIADPPLKRGAKYAYVVSVKTDNRKYQNNGVSEVCWFTYGESPAPKTESKVLTNTKPVKSNSGIVFYPPASYQPIPITSIKGKLIYAFRKSEEPGTLITSASAADISGKTMTMNNASADALFNNPDFFVAGQASDQTNSGIFESMTEKAGKSPKAPIGSGSPGPMVIGGNGTYSVTKTEMPDLFPKLEYVDVNEQKWKDAEAAYAGAAGKERFPLSNSYVEIRCFLKSAYMKFNTMLTGFGADPTSFLLGSAITDKDGNFSITYNGGDIPLDHYNAALVVKDSIQFDYPKVYLPIKLSAFGDYEIGEVLGLANTFRLKVNLINTHGNKIENASVKILRSSGFYGDKSYLSPEGNRFFTNQDTPSDKDSKGKPDQTSPSERISGLNPKIASIMDELVAKSNTDLKFYRLFNPADPVEVYMMQISAEDYIGGEVPLYYLPDGNFITSGASINSSTKNGIMTVSATFMLLPEKSKVKGRVIDKTTEVPVPDVKVTLHNEDNSRVYTTKTAKDGTFKIKNIDAGPDNFTLTVSGSNIKEWTDPQQLQFKEDGTIVNRDPLYVHALLIPVMGVVTDLTNIALNNAELKWKDGGKSFYTGSNGHYIGYNLAGKHTLVVSKPGFKSKEIQVDLSLPPKTDYKAYMIGTGNIKSAQPGDAMKNMASQYGNILLASKDGVNYASTKPFGKPQKVNIDNNPGVKFYNVLADEDKISAIFGLGTGNDEESDYGPAVTLDTIKLSQFYVSVKVKDKDTKAPIGNAVLTVNDEEKEFKSDSAGIAVLSNVPEGSSTIYVSAPEGTNYVAASASVAVQPSQDTTYVEISLGGGAKLSGKVTSSGKALANAEIFVEGSPYIKTKTDAGGNYTFGVPVGEYTIVASKTGLVADSKMMTFEKKDYTQDFELKDPGFDASKILGFDLVLYDSKPQSDPNEFKISGVITHIPSNALFKIPNSKKLEFFGQVVVKQGSIIVPKSGTLVLADQELDFKLWDYLNVTLKKTGGLQVKPLAGDNTKGSIGGDLLLDVLKTFGNKYGLSWPGGGYKLLDGTSSEFNAFYSTGALPSVKTSLKLSAPASGWDIYGVKLTPDFNNTFVDMNGISFAGKIDLDGIPGLGSASLALKTFQIGTNGDIKKLEINLSPNPKIDFLSWQMVLNNIGLNQYGLRFGGELTIPIPGSGSAVFKFSDVNVTKSGIDGGSYALKGSINFFGVADFSGLPSNPLSFGKVPGTGDYRINGGGSLNFSSLLDKPVEIQDFLVQTNGIFGFTAAPNLNFDFAGGIANFKLNSIGFYPSKSEFSVSGGFGLDIPGIGGAVSSSIHYAKSKISIDKLGLAASMGGIGSFSADVEFGDNKFAGSGKLLIAGVAGMGMSFSYEKIPGGKSVSASISTGITVPVGVVTFENIGGGFSYNSAPGKYGVNLTGRMTLAPGTSALVALENMIVGVEASGAGPSLYGSAEPYVISMKAGTAEFKLDIPQKSFYISTTLGANFNVIPSINMAASGSFILAASARSSDPYWLMAVYTHVNMLGLFNENLNITGAWNLNRAAHPEYNSYTSFIPEIYLNSGKINGINASFNSLQGRLSDNPYCHDAFGIANLCAYAYADMSLNIHSNFASGVYGFDVSQKWGAGGNADFFGVGLAGANVSIGFGLSGAYGGGNWTINGNGSADATAYIGCTDGGCGNGITWKCCVNPCWPWDDCDVCPCPCGGKICLHPSVNVGYSSATGKFDVGMDW